MNNKYLISRNQNVRYINDNIDEFVSNCLDLSRYSEEDPYRATAERNFREAFDYIVNGKEIENDYESLCTLHEILMKDLDSNVLSVLNEEQIIELHTMINQPAKSNTEIAIDVMLYVLNKRLFSDGDVRVSMMFANKIMVDNGCGIITIRASQIDTFRQLMKDYKTANSGEFKEWIYSTCIKGPKGEY